MANSYLKKEEVIRAIPNWLASEVGIITQTAISEASMASDVNGKKIIKSGTVIKKGGSTVIGLLFGADVDISDGDELIPILVAGRVYENRLPATITSDKEALQALGIIFENAGEVTRPY